MGIYNANVSELFSQGSSALFGRDGFLTKYFEAATRLPITPSIYTLHPSFHLIHPLIPPSSSPYIHSSPHFSSYIFSSLHHPLHTYTPPFISPHTPSHPSTLPSIYTLSPSFLHILPLIPPPSSPYILSPTFLLIHPLISTSSSP